MSKNLNRSITILLFVSLYITATVASSTKTKNENKPIFYIKKTNKIIINDYLELQKKFSKEMCRPGTEPKFLKLYKNFRGDGNFIPLLLNGDLDKLTISKYLPELQLKEKWIRNQITKLRKTNNFKSYLLKINKLEKEFSRLLLYKKSFFNAKTDSKKSIIRNKSKYQFIIFKEKLNNFLDEIPFLTSYRYPVDHMSLRLSYDKFKIREDLKGKTKSNEIYFYRKIVQDGAQNKNHKRSDRFLRANIDTIKLHLKESSDFISENLRFDIKSILKVTKAHLKKGKKVKIPRLLEWANRVKRAQYFYTLLKDNKVAIGSRLMSGSDVLEQKAKARYVLKDFVLSKERDSFNFWKNKPALMRSLFSIETILFNEVGSIDGRDGLERRDVTQIIINRTRIPNYHTITSKESIHGYLSGGKLDDISKYPWLGSMFKEGEFSFTYFFIPGNAKIYCPDMSRRGQFLRKENLKIALEYLRKPKNSFKAVRYFSRASMLGSIDMAKIWSDFKPIHERAGKKSGNQRSLKRLYSQGKYKFLYDFIDPAAIHYKVIEIRKKNYVMPRNKIIFFKHRNPHYFRYFEKKDQ